jgi:hypothetical protein
MSAIRLLNLSIPVPRLSWHWLASIQLINKAPAVCLHWHELESGFLSLRPFTILTPQRRARKFAAYLVEMATLASTKLDNLTLEHLLEAGLDQPEAQELLQKVLCSPVSAKASPVAAWNWISREILTPQHPLKLHQMLFSAAYYDWDKKKGPPAVWQPTE